MGDVDHLNDIINNQVEVFLKEIAEEEGFETYKIEKAPGSMKGDGYLGAITAVYVIGKISSGEEKTLHLIVKTASKSDAVRVEAPLADVYEREIYMYKTVIPAFHRLEKERNLSRSLNSAKCYKACMVEKNEALIFENLKVSGYSVWEKGIPMKHDHVSLVMSDYGRFHAMSLAMRDQEPERFKNLTRSMHDIFDKFMEKADFTKMFVNQCRKALKSLDPVADKKSYNTFKKFIDEKLEVFFTNMAQYVDDYSVILHGDCHSNNMMFKYEDKDNPQKPTNLCLIDLQISRLGPSVFDLSYFLYACSSKEVLDNHKLYLNIYYEKLSLYLKKLGSNPDKVYPHAIFQEQWKKYSKFGLICSMVLIHMLVSKQDEVIDFTDITESGQSLVDAFNYDIENLEVYNNRVRDVILHFVDNEYI
ncbi:hypothetical protein ILUMI_04402 [Ignelater luminosus]|uniref:CHK kinase-like domain-containing protein n=1 Tax=Ignelater luminosus TaxID=2038154 RepID=A0A8K0GJM0_IGNLU|nr:hypothetical protein ILUMI_04402 [Ignelater luminosus]